MAGVVKSRKLMAKNLGFRSIFILAFISMIVLAGCTNPQPNDNYYASLSPAQKKAELQKSLEKNFEDSQTHFLLGQLYQTDKLWDDAEYQYNLALRFDPVYRPAQAAMVKLLLDRGDPVKAQH
jgi:Tfp pilus assembly protein PilF